jgi:hypothetical protein
MPIRDNVFQFEADLQAFCKATDARLELVVKKIVFELLKKIILRTPVDTGRAAGSWATSKGEAGSEMLPEGKFGSAETAASKAASNLDNISFDPPGGVFWIYNNLPYIEVLEFGLYASGGMNAPWGKAYSTGKTVAGFSIQAPAGMVRISIAEVEAEMKSILEAAA